MATTENTGALSRRLADSPLRDWAQTLPAIEGQRSPQRHGDYQRWQAALDRLPDLSAGTVLLDQPVVTVRGNHDEARVAGLRADLLELHPWRKGPYHLHGVDIDTEWRSDLKWARVAPALHDLAGRTVLDIGCGSGYHLWRMLGAGARLALGVEPTPVFVMQFRAVRHFIGDDRAWVLPLALEEMPPDLSGFDTVFSMGLLYHRRSPLDHLADLLRLVRPGGQVVVETLVVRGDERQVLVPENRYARMRNVWFIPSAALLMRWMRRCRFTDVTLIDETDTTTEEQRSTDWMRFESLSQCLDPDRPQLTVEGHPAPRRAVITGVRPKN